MQTHAFPAGLGASMRLRSVLDPFFGCGTAALTKKKAPWHQPGTTATIKRQHLDFAIPKQLTPVVGSRQP